MVREEPSTLCKNGLTLRGHLRWHFWPPRGCWRPCDPPLRRTSSSPSRFWERKEGVEQKKQAIDRKEALVSLFSNSVCICVCEFTFDRRPGTKKASPQSLMDPYCPHSSRKRTLGSIAPLPHVGEDFYPALRDNRYAAGREGVEDAPARLRVPSRAEAEPMGPRGPANRWSS